MRSGWHGGALRSGRIADVCSENLSAALRTMLEEFGGVAYGRYGFADAFNPASGWVDPEVLGIDQGSRW
jgi:hypothetical protein